MANQAYRNFEYSISVKGVPDKAAHHMLMREWQPFVDKGWLHVRFDENKTQFSNFLDTVRDIDLNHFDYVCKIDDDDWYAPDYLKNVNASLRANPGTALSFTGRAMILTETVETTHFNQNISALSGPTMCWHRDVVKAALDIEKDSKNMSKYIPNFDVNSFIHVREDNLLHRLGESMGKTVHRKTDWWQVIFGWQYRSVIRGGNYVDVSKMKM